MTPIRILFLGASKRVTLIERFLSAADTLQIAVEVFSCEYSKSFCPISAYATVLEGPGFRGSEFPVWLANTAARLGIHMIIPNMDAAATGLSLAKRDGLLSNETWGVVSDYGLCAATEDKLSANELFMKQGLLVPGDSPGAFPKILKPRLGFGARGCHLVHNADDIQYFVTRNPEMDYVTQDFINGQETTADLYFDRSKNLVGYCLRDRLEVSDGEVMVCKTRKSRPDEAGLINRVSQIDGWEGCITLQYIDSKDRGLFVIEINPRFGGGVTCSIEAGLDIPYYLLCDYLGRSYRTPHQLRRLIMTRARKDYFYEYE